MNKIFHLIIEAICWFLIMLSPTLVFAIIAFILVSKYDNLSFFYIVIVGVIIGGFIAERIRRKVGCATYLGRILSTPDIWPTDKGKDDKNNVP